MTKNLSIPDTETGRDPETLKLLLQIYEDTNQIMQLMIAREMPKGE